MSEYKFGYTVAMPQTMSSDGDKTTKLKTIFGDDASITLGGSKNECTVVTRNPLDETGKKLLQDEGIAMVSEPVTALVRMIRIEFDKRSTGIADAGDGEALQASVDAAEDYLASHGISQDAPVPMNSHVPVNISLPAAEA